jgi:poly(U)-specific endoribonuclease
LASLSKACDKLWDLDTHRLTPNKDYSINIQQGKKIYESGDKASEPLFRFVNEEILHKPTFKAFIALLDNYFESLGQKEVVTLKEKEENKLFINLIMDTEVMQYVHQYLLLLGFF